MTQRRDLARRRRPTGTILHGKRRKLHEIIARDLPRDRRQLPASGSNCGSKGEAGYAWPVIQRRTAGALIRNFGAGWHSLIGTPGVLRARLWQVIHSRRLTDAEPSFKPGWATAQPREGGSKQPVASEARRWGGSLGRWSLANVHQRPAVSGWRLSGSGAQRYKAVRQLHSGWYCLGAGRTTGSILGQ